MTKDEKSLLNITLFPPVTMEEEPDHVYGINASLSENELILEENDPIDICLLRTFIHGIPPEMDQEEQEDIWIRVKTSISQQLQHQVDETIEKQKKTLPECYKEFASIFDKDISE